MNGKPGRYLNVLPCSPDSISHTNGADTLKGSYYANPVVDESSIHPSLREAHPEYYGNNICRCRIFVPQMTSNFEYCRAQGREGH